MKIFNNLILYILFFFYSSQLFSADLVNVRFGSNEQGERIVIDLTDDISFNSSIEKTRVILSFDKEINYNFRLKKNRFLERIDFNKKTNQIILNFKKQLFSSNIYLLKKKNNKYARIVIDFKNNSFDTKVIIIDAGHGGRDSGAVGVNKILEKDITLKMAKLLKKKFSKYKDIKVVLTRNKDIFLKLKTRTKIAKGNNADIFISLHADFNKNKKARGISLYTLSERASDKEAEALARRENKSDLIGGVDFSNESNEVTNILIDLTKRETLNQSSFLANFLIDEFKDKLNLLQRTHRFAGFAVLKSLDIPSILIEMGYLSNKKDARLLTSSEYQNKLANNIVGAIRNYFYWKEKNSS